jgi:hypothetical protein
MVFSHGFSHTRIINYYLHPDIFFEFFKSLNLNFSGKKSYTVHGEPN